MFQNLKLRTNFSSILNKINKEHEGTLGIPCPLHKHKPGFLSLFFSSPYNSSKVLFGGRCFIIWKFGRVVNFNVVSPRFWIFGNTKALSHILPFLETHFCTGKTISKVQGLFFICVKSKFFREASFR